jgi:hypothetical protein
VACGAESYRGASAVAQTPWSALRTILPLNSHKKARGSAECRSQPSEDDLDVYFRTIRFTTIGGEVLDVFCEASATQDLEPRAVPVLRPLKKPKPRNWLLPQTKPVKEVSGK